MKILFPCSINPITDSSAISNRYNSLINGLLSIGVEIKIVVLEGYSSKQNKTNFINKNSNLLSLCWTHKFPNYGYFRPRFYKYLLVYLFNIKNYLFLKKEFKKQYDFIFITENIVARKVYLNSNDDIIQKGVIEFSEYQNLSSSIPNSLIAYLNSIAQRKRFKVTMKIIQIVPNFLIMTRKLIPYYQNLANNNNARFLHLPMTVDLDRFNQNFKIISGFIQPYILYVGVMNDKKDGVNILIDAFSKIVDRFPKYKLYLVGPWQYDTINHLNKIKQLNLTNSIIWKGSYDKEYIPSILIDSSLLVLPRPSSRQADGGFPTKLGEYLASGTPVCSTRVGEIANYLVDNESVYFAEPDSVDSFADAMCRALSNLDQAKNVGKNGSKVAEKYFNKDIQAQKLYNFLIDFKK
jgi:glycosyltransferase involved in cell wall biosynthesis